MWKIVTFTDYNGTKPKPRVVIRDSKNYTVAIVEASGERSARDNATLIVNAVNNSLLDEAVILLKRAYKLNHDDFGFDCDWQDFMDKIENITKTTAT